jgi:hypothetical protein
LSHLEIAQKTHEKFIEEYLTDTLFMYNASDATAIPLREKPTKKPKKEPKLKRKRGRPKKGEKVEPKQPTILAQQKRMHTTEEMLSILSTQCGVGVKQNAKGYKETWVGGKLHISAVDGDIHVTAIYTGANVHDSSVALPLIKETSGKVSYLHDLLDAEYDVENRKLKHLRTDGKEITVSIGKEAVNFDQIKVDDMVSATVAKELIVSVNKQNVSTEEGADGIVAIAPKGKKPGGIIGETVVVTAKVVEIDQEKRTATIQFKDGETKTIAVRDDIDLSKHKIGEQVVFQITEMIAIKVEKQ